VAPTPAIHLSPSMHLDTGLNMVIIEFCDASGRVTGSLPTAQALAQFRLNMGSQEAQPTATTSQAAVEPASNAHGGGEPSNPLPPASAAQATVSSAPPGPAVSGPQPPSSAKAGTSSGMMA
jgi:hypothetical protein